MNGVPKLMFTTHPAPLPSVATSADTPSSGSGPVSGREEPSLANGSVFWHPYQLDLVMLRQFHQGLMAVPD